MKKKRIVFISPYSGIRNVQLLKDVGLIPYYLYKNYDADVSILTEKIDDYSYAETYVKGLKFEFIDKLDETTRYEYVKDNALNIDCIIAFGFYGSYILPLITYKMLNPNGKIYMALDANSFWVDRVDFRNEYFTAMMNCCDVIATSCRAMQRHLNEKWPWNIEYISNGYFDYIGDNIPPDYSKKENIIINVARLGTNQKRTEILMESFAQICDKIPDWKLYLIGNIEKSFEEYIEDYFIKYPHLMTKVIFKGVISDKLQLVEEYKKSKIFALSSNLEGGTPNVISEALFYGNAVVTTKIDAYEDAIDCGRCGKFARIGDIPDFAEKLLELCLDDNLEKMCCHAHNYAKRNYNMSRNVDKVYEMLFGGEDDEI